MQVKLQNGDLVLFNRQPSLHAASIMCHEVRIRPGHTFALNSACLGPYAADCDGDEMNLFLPQTPEALAEAGEILAVQHNIMSGQVIAIIGPIQDTVLGIYRVCADTFTASEAMRLRGRASGPLPGSRFLPTSSPSTTGPAAGAPVHGVLEGASPSRPSTATASSCKSYATTWARRRPSILFMRCKTSPTPTLIFAGFLSASRTRASMRSFEHTAERVRRGLRRREGKEEEEVNERLNQCPKTLGKACLAQRRRTILPSVRAGAKGNMSNLVWILEALASRTREAKDPRISGPVAPCTWSRKRPWTADSSLTTTPPGCNPRVLVRLCKRAQGLVDTAIKTSQTGYVERKLMRPGELRTVTEGSWTGTASSSSSTATMVSHPSRTRKFPPGPRGPSHARHVVEDWSTYLLEYKDAAKVEYSTIPVGQWHYHGDGSLEINDDVYRTVRE